MLSSIETSPIHVRSHDVFLSLWDETMVLMVFWVPMAQIENFPNLLSETARLTEDTI